MEESTRNVDNNVSESESENVNNATQQASNNENNGNEANDDTDGNNNNNNNDGLLTFHQTVASGLAAATSNYTAMQLRFVSKMKKLNGPY